MPWYTEYVTNRVYDWRSQLSRLGFLFLRILFEDCDGDPSDVFVAAPLEAGIVVCGLDFFLVDESQSVFDVDDHETVEVDFLVGAYEHVDGFDHGDDGCIETSLPSTTQITANE